MKYGEFYVFAYRGNISNPRDVMSVFWYLYPEGSNLKGLNLHRIRRVEVARGILSRYNQINRGDDDRSKLNKMVALERDLRATLTTSKAMKSFDVRKINGSIYEIRPEDLETLIRDVYV